MDNMLIECSAGNRKSWPDFVATPTGFEPAIFAVTGQYVKPLHHGAAFNEHACKFVQICYVCGCI